ncbi:MAG: flagellar FliJ family protein [Alphaproteobacteria bacterium]|nr:flagellar FliJ family protein [Alphaproteobacteria bacterium]
MKNALQILGRIEKFNINEQRKILVALQEQQDIIISKLSALNQQFELDKECQRQNQLVGDFGAYVKKYLETKESYEAQIASLEQQIEQVRDIIADMYKEQKTYEIIDENRQKRAQHEEDLKLQKQLDEIGTNSYIKHHEEIDTGE